MPKLRPEFLIVEDAIDLESQNERLHRPRLVDEEAQARADEPPIGDGTYLLTCIDCARPFRSNDIRQTLCPVCDADDAVLFQNAWLHNYNYGRRKFRRGSGWE